MLPVVERARLKSPGVFIFSPLQFALTPSVPRPTRPTPQSAPLRRRRSAEHPLGLGRGASDPVDKPRRHSPNPCPRPTPPAPDNTLPFANRIIFRGASGTH